MTSTTKVKVGNCNSKLKSHITKQLLTGISVDMRIYRQCALKSGIHLGLAAPVNYHFFG